MVEKLVYPIANAVDLHSNFLNFITVTILLAGTINGVYFKLYIFVGAIFWNTDYFFCIVTRNIFIKISVYIL